MAENKITDFTRKLTGQNGKTGSNGNNNNQTGLPEQPESEKVEDVAVARVIPRVVVIGAGFGGLSVARNLSDKDVKVLVLDRSNYHGFWPLLYQVATAGLDPESIAYPVRAIFRKFKNVDFQMADVRSIDFDNKQVLTDGDPVDYDYLVIAAGSTNNFFGNQALEENTYGLKDIEEAVELRNHVLSCFEQAVREKDPERRKALLTFVLAGGGPTGVELAGAFAELIRHVLRKDYPMLDVSEARIMLVEAAPEVLATFPEKLRRKAMQQLERLGVEVHTKMPVKTLKDNVLYFADGSQLAAETVVWSAGVRAAQLADQLGVAQARGARVKVESTLQLPGRPEVFVIGDMAYLEGYKKGQAYPMVAPVAIQMGKQASKNILAQVQRKPVQKFKYFDKGSMATIGRRSAVFDAFGVRLTGGLAWLTWLFVHLMYLVGFRNRVIVFLNWAYNYFTYDRAARLITGRRPVDTKVEKKPVDKLEPVVLSKVESDNKTAAGSGLN
ncbi:MAG TPA: NAD(P)/FAD-dependent oxidoreductase [Chloroflexia bacterium]|nr:NAD(P)/FAD-dependent oxidoreductase [Chloroflexia bacterium]